MEHLFMCFQGKIENSVTWGDVLRLTSWRCTLFWIVFLFFSCLPAPGHCLRASVLYSSAGLVNFKGPKPRFSSCCYKKCPQGGSTSSCFTQVPGAADQFHSVKPDFATPWAAARQASLSITNSWSLLKLMSIELVMPSNHLIFCRPLLLPPSIFPITGFI